MFSIKTIQKVIAPPIVIVNILMKFLIVFACLLALSTATPDKEWESFKTKFNKMYPSPAEEAYRKEVFLANKMTIDQHNRLFDKGEFEFTLGINEFSDMTNEEFQKQMSGHVIAPLDPSIPFHENTGKISPPTFDWRDMKCVTWVKNQGRTCGSCWAFSATGAVESVTCIKTGKLVELSEQELIDCSWKNGNEGCTEGYEDKAFEYIISKQGLDKESDYPYEGRLRQIPEGSESSLLNAVVMQPVSVSIDDSDPSFQHYNGSYVYNVKKCSRTKLGHSLLAVGYGTTKDGKDYWILKNSWGTSWGDKGYMYLARNKRNKCGVATQAIYPVYG